MKKSNTSFFLTGGTALSRYYFNHRYSDYLDLFVNNDKHYFEQTNILLKLFFDSEKIGVIKESIKRGKDFTQVIIVDKNFHLELRVDIINDVANHFGELEYDDVLGKIDS